MSCRAAPARLARGSTNRSSSSSTPGSVGRVLAKPTTVPSADVATRVRPRASRPSARTRASGCARRTSRSPSFDMDALRKIRATAGSSPAVASRTSIVITGEVSYRAGTLGDMSTLDRFSEATRAWFSGAFEAPTPAQEGAWSAISSGEHALVVAPTGSGKTLAAFLWSLDRLASIPPPADAQARCRVLYVSPLKALAVDVERNLRAPLTGIGQAAARLGLAPPESRVGIRSGDTPADERRAMARRPPDILITTPESLFLLLTSSAREALRGVETVIVDEVHAVTDSKRGAHLAVSLDRLDELLERPAQRIG